MRFPLGKAADVRVEYCGLKDRCKAGERVGAHKRVAVEPKRRRTHVVGVLRKNTPSVAAAVLQQGIVLCALPDRETQTIAAVMLARTRVRLPLAFTLPLSLSLAFTLSFSLTFAFAFAFAFSLAFAFTLAFSLSLAFTLSRWLRRRTPLRACSKRENQARERQQGESMDHLGPLHSSVIGQVLPWLKP
jgi:hypothetical protein